MLIDPDPGHGPNHHHLLPRDTRAPPLSYSAQALTPPSPLPGLDEKAENDEEPDEEEEEEEENAGRGRVYWAKALLLAPPGDLDSPIPRFVSPPPPSRCGGNREAGDDDDDDEVA